MNTDRERFMMPPKLWTKDFTIITVGTVISLVGNCMAKFATGLLVLDYTGSTFLYALYMVLYTAPQIIAPTIAGPFIDKFSRKKTIYSLDFTSGVIYAIFAALILSGHMNYYVLIIGSMLLGTINSIYQVAYDSFYPMLITEGNYSKAYSIASTLESLTTIMIPVSALIYNLVGIGPLFLFDMLTFFAAAIMETRITAKETYIKKIDEDFGLKQYRQTFKEGVAYLRQEKGLRIIVIYFVIIMFCSESDSVLALPYFRNHYPNGEYIYIAVMAFMMIGRFIGGGIHYRRKIKPERKFTVAMIVYVTISVVGGLYLYCPIPIMMLFCFINGIMGVTSYNIRISATQSYVPDDKKGRFNGISQMLLMLGMLIGQFASGALSEFLSERTIITLFMGFNLLAAFGVMYRGREHVKQIYNRIT